MTTETAPEAKSEPIPRRRLLRDLVMFQMRLFADGLRDLLLSPLSVLAVVVDILSGNKSQSGNFYALLRAGRRSDHWIDLFGAAERAADEAPDSELDKVLDRLEAEVALSYREGKINAAAQQALDRARRLLRRNEPHQSDDSP